MNAIEEIKSNRYAEGTLGVFKGNPQAEDGGAAIRLFPLNNTEAIETFGDATFFVRLEGNPEFPRLIGVQPEGVVEEWSVAGFDGPTYIRQVRGRLVDANFECDLNADGQVLSGTLNIGIKVEGVRQGTQTYRIGGGTLSADRQTFKANLYDPNNEGPRIGRMDLRVRS